MLVLVGRARHPEDFEFSVRFLSPILCQTNPISSPVIRNNTYAHNGVMLKHNINYRQLVFYAYCGTNSKDAVAIDNTRSVQYYASSPASSETTTPETTLTKFRYVRKFN